MPKNNQYKKTLTYKSPNATQIYSEDTDNEGNRTGTFSYQKKALLSKEGGIFSELNNLTVLSPYLSLKIEESFEKVKTLPTKNSSYDANTPSADVTMEFLPDDDPDKIGLGFFSYSPKYFCFVYDFSRKLKTSVDKFSGNYLMVMYDFSPLFEGNPDKNYKFCDLLLKILSLDPSIEDMTTEDKTNEFFQNQFKLPAFDPYVSPFYWTYLVGIKGQKEEKEKNEKFIEEIKSIFSSTNIDLIYTVWPVVLAALAEDFRMNYGDPENWVLDDPQKVEFLHGVDNVKSAGTLWKRTLQSFLSLDKIIQTTQNIADNSDESSSPRFIKIHQNLERGYGSPAMKSYTSMVTMCMMSAIFSRLELTPSGDFTSYSLTPFNHESEVIAANLAANMSLQFNKAPDPDDVDINHNPSIYALTAEDYEEVGISPKEMSRILQDSFKAISEGADKEGMKLFYKSVFPENQPASITSNLMQQHWSRIITNVTSETLPAGVLSLFKNRIKIFHHIQIELKKHFSEA